MIMKLLQRAIILVFILSVAIFSAAYWKMSRQNGGSAPQILMEESSITISIASTDEDILAGISAYDAEDGDVTDSLIVESLSNFVETGRRVATITAFDSDCNVTRISREVVYSDYESPRLSLSAPLRFVYTGTVDIESTLTVTDCLDGDLSEEVTITTEDSVYSKGSYTFTYEVSNSVGDMVSLTATVDFYDSSEDITCPHAVLSEYLIYLDQGDEIDPTDYITGVTYGGTYYGFQEMEADEEEEAAYTLEDIQIDNPVDTSTPGTYEISYTMQSSVSYYQTVIRLIVIVE